MFVCVELGSGQRVAMVFIFLYSVEEMEIFHLYIVLRRDLVDCFAILLLVVLKSIYIYI